MEERKDTISRQTAIDALDRIFDRCEEIETHLSEGDPDRTGYKMYPDYMTVWKYLHQLPSAQPEIIRCKDCKHRPIEKNGWSFPPKDDDEKCPCLCEDPFYSWIPGDNFFCANAERREDE